MLTRKRTARVAVGLVLLASPLLAQGPLEEATQRAVASGRIVVLTPRPPAPDLVGGTALGLVDAPVDATWEALNDFNHYATFMPRVRVAHLVDAAAWTQVAARAPWERGALEALLVHHPLDRPQDERFFFYNVLDAPFPVRDRWYLLEMRRDLSAHTLRWTLVAGNLKATQGGWTLRPWPADPRRTLAEYTSYSDTGLPLPAFVLRAGLTQTLPDVIRGLRRRLAEVAR
jgi:hypothetical protein